MAPTPTHPRTPRRDGTDSARPYRNADTNAGVNRHQGPRNATRGRGTHRRRGRNDYAPVAAPVRPTLASRMTYGDTRGRGGAARPRSQYAGRLQDRTTIGHGHVDRAALIQQVNHGAQARGRNDMRAPVNHLNANEGDHSSLFFDPQPADISPPPPSLHRPTHQSPSAPIRMMKEPLPKDPPSPPKRPINTYRGKDPIKRLCQNKKLQAILADKPIPKERQKVAGDRMMLRMGVNGITK
jgi:hypothetical protein